MSVAHENGSAPTTQADTVPLRFRRAPVACTSCRRRKIRCDVTVHGSPCTNCRLDNDRCIIINLRRSRKAKNAVQPRPTRLLQDALPPSLPGPSFDGPGRPPVPATTNPTSVIQEGASAQDLYPIRLLPQLTQLPPHATITSPTIIQGGASAQDLYPIRLSAELDQLPPHELAYLTSQKALTLPQQSTVFTLLRHYFFHIHPCFPIVKESEFRQSTYHQRPFSLLVFRAMLFAAACHAPPKTATDAGYTSVQHMRLSLYKKAKYLYDFGIEKNSFHITQAALLLTFHFDTSDALGNTVWLSTAVHHTLKISKQRRGLFSSKAEDPSDLKRLWWCCVLRDRVLAVAHRQPLEITPDQFDTTKEEMLTMDEVWDQDSEYSTPAARIILYQALLSQCQLATILTKLVVSIDPCTGLTSSNTCIEKERALFKYTLWQLYQAEEQCRKLLETEEAQSNILVGVNIHLTIFFYLAARLTVWHRLDLLTGLECLCDAALDSRETYLQGIADLVMMSNEQVKWFARSQTFELLPYSVRCFSILPMSLNILWLDGGDPEELISQPGHPLKPYYQLDKVYMARFGEEAHFTVARQYLAVIVACYDSAHGYTDRHNFSLGLATSTSEEKDRLADICLRLSILIDYTISKGNCEDMSADFFSSLFTRLEIRCQPYTCSGASTSQSLTELALYGQEYSSSSSSQNTLSFLGSPDYTSSSDSGSDVRNLATYQQFSLMSELSHNELSIVKADNGPGTLERLNSVIEQSSYSMQDFATGVEDLLGPLFGC
ncbi:hypothetical protein BJX70DRAFT_94207 [Aspergillus crustosus]